MKNHLQPEPGIQVAQTSVWKLMWQCSNSLLVALVIGSVLAFPVVHYSVTARYKSYAEVVYQVGNSPHEEDRFVQWARSSPGVENLLCERHEGNLWVRWEYRGVVPPEAERDAGLHLKALGYTILGYDEKWGAIPRNLSGRIADVLSDPVPLTVILLGTQLSLALVGWWQIRAATLKGHSLPPLFARNYGRSISTGLITGLTLFGLGWLYTTGVKELFGSSPPSHWDAVGTMPISTRMTILLFGALGAPVAEETFFRGYVFGIFKRANKVGYGILVSAVLFAMAHFSDLYNVPAVFLYGVVLAWAFHRTGSLLTSMLAHALNNCLAIGATLLQ